MLESTKAGAIPATKGTGAVKYYLKLDGSIGIRTCSHLNGYNRPKKA
jgi:hypothetical protein